MKAIPDKFMKAVEHMEEIELHAAGLVSLIDIKDRSGKSFKNIVMKNLYDFHCMLRAERISGFSALEYVAEYMRTMKHFGKVGFFDFQAKRALKKYQKSLDTFAKLNESDPESNLLGHLKDESIPINQRRASYASNAVDFFRAYGAIYDPRYFLCYRPPAGSKVEPPFEGKFGSYKSADVQFNAYNVEVTVNDDEVIATYGFRYNEKGDKIINEVILDLERAFETEDSDSALSISNALRYPLSPLDPFSITGNPAALNDALTTLLGFRIVDRVVFFVDAPRGTFVNEMTVRKSGQNSKVTMATHLPTNTIQ